MAGRRTKAPCARQKYAAFARVHGVFDAFRRLFVDAAGLEVLAVPAIPLTMTAGVIFGPWAGTAIVSIAATLAATIAFLLARYAARDRVLAIASKNPKFAAIDRWEAQ